MFVSAPGNTAFSVAVGTPPATLVQLGLPVLGGPADENLFPGVEGLREVGAWRLAQNPEWLVGGAVVLPQDDLETATARLYAEMFAVIGNRSLPRCWNYVPAINATGPGGLENYQVFCRGRSVAFETRFGAAFARHLPAASAVGTTSGKLGIVFAACSGQVQHLENPLQMPAYQYPREYGPRSPSFARATRVRTVTGERVFISGTAAIRGHATMAPDRTADQVDCTLQNLAEIAKTCDLGPDFGAGQACERHFKIYLRHAADLPETAALLERRLLRPSDAVTYLEADICRQALNVEIEATITLR